MKYGFIICSVLLALACLTDMTFLVFRQNPVVPMERDPNKAIAKLQNSGSLRDIIIPTDARLLGIHEEGLSVFMAMEMPAGEVKAFRNQRSFEGYNEEAGETNFGEQSFEWWTPDRGKVIYRLSGIMPDKRALAMSINAVIGDNASEHMFIYLERFPL